MKNNGLLTPDKKLFFIVLCIVLLSSKCVFAHLVGYWKFDGSTLDSSGGGHTAFFVGDADYASDSPFEQGQSIYLDGNEDYLIVSDHNDFDFTTSFTIAMWIKPTQSGIGILLDKWKYPYSYQMQINSDQLGPWVWTNDGYSGAYISSGITINEWQHIAFTYDGTYLSTYRNGSFTGNTGASGSLNSSTGDIFFGSQGSTYDFNGYMDEIRMYNEYLNEAQILDLFINGAINPIPEPASLFLLGLGIISVLKGKKRK